MLRESHFGVERRGDLVTAWLRGYSRPESETALALLGRLMACTRQLDLLLKSDAAVTRCAEQFLLGDLKEGLLA